MSEEAARAAIQAFAANSVIQIFAAGLVPLGTGTLFEVGERAFIVCARHLFDDMDGGLLQSIAVPEGPRGAIVEIAPVELFRPSYGERHLDIALIELKDPDVIALLKRSWRFLSLSDVAEAPSSGQFVLSAYPQLECLAEKDQRTLFDPGISTVREVARLTALAHQAGHH